MAAGLLTAQPGGWTGAPSGDGGASVPDAWPPSGDAAFAGLLPGYAFAQVQDSTPPTFVSSGFDGTALTITFSETIAAANVDPAKIHVRESGSYAGGITLTAGELDTSADADTISFALTESNLAAVKGLDTPELTIEPGAVRDTAGNPIVGTFDVSTATHIDGFDVSGNATRPQGMAFSSDGAKMFVVGSTVDNVNEYTLTAPFDISMATFTNVTFNVGEQEGNPRGMAFSSDGAKMFVVGSTVDNVNEYTLTAPFDISTATFTNVTFNVGEQDRVPTDMAFSSDGTKMFILGSFDDDVNEYTLTAPFDISTATFANVTFPVVKEEGNPQGMAFSSDGSKMFVVGPLGGNVNEYTLTAPFDISTAAFANVTFSVSTEDGTPTGMAFSSDGSKMFVVGSAEDNVNEYALSSVYPIVVVTNTPPPDDAFVTTWEVETSPYVIHMPVEIHTGATATIDWGDGSTTDVSANGTQQHTYATAGNYTVAITGGLGRINLGESASADKLASLDQWGDIAWTTMKEAFRKATGMVYNATDAPDLSGVTSMQNMFRDAEKFDGNLSGWNVSGVANMDGTFRGASVFDGDLSAWDTSGANDTRKMFQEATSFNGDISSWNTTGVAHMDSMFRDATAFNQTLSGWDVSGVANMASMLEGAAAFNGDLSGWNVSSVTDMFAMLSGATDFNGDLSGWNVSGVTDMAGMFWNAPKFNADISGWNVSAVTDMFGMFRDATAFNSDISGWNVSGVTDMEDMFRDATAFNSDISGWNVSSVTDMTQMLTGANGFSQNLGKWYITLDSTSADLASDTTVGTILPQNDWLAGSQSGAYGIAETHDHEFFEINGTSLNVKDGADYTGKTDYAVNITSTHPFGANNHRLVDVTVTDTSMAFKTTWNTAAPNEGITIPATGPYDIDWGDGTAESVTGPKTHTYADAGNHAVTISGGLTRINLGADPDNAAKLASIDQWGDMEWTTMEGAFQGASNMAYNAADAPDLSGVTNMTGMFQFASAFNGNVSGWDVSGVTDMRGMFSGASDFNGNVSGWDVSGVTDMRDMFSGASDFNGNVSGWDVSGVTDMANMFGSARDFNADLSGWDVSRVTDMYGMFWGAEKFDSDLSGWNVSGVTDMANMFQSASDFNGNVSGWNVSTVTGMNGMFWGAEKFNSDLSGWNVSGVTDMHRMFFNAHAFNGNVSGWNVSGVTDMFGMFYNAAAFNADLSGWNVSRVTDMTSIFQGATLFRQNLGNWFVVPADTHYDNSEASLNVTTVAAQNPYLDGRTFTYGIGDGHDFDSFNMTGSTLMLKSAPSAPAYKVNVTAVGSIFGTNNHRILDITVDGVDPNTNPVLDDIAPQSVNELVRLEFNATATDTDTLVFSLVDPYPDGASIGGNTGTFAWTPGEAQDGNHTVTVRVSDGRGGEHSRDVQIEVREVNLPPELAVATAHEATELEPLEFNATATDPDTVGAEQTPNDLTFSLDGEPDGAAINSTTGAFSWTPGADQNGTHTMDVRVSDGIYTDSEAVTVTVADSGPGSLPQGAFVTTWKADPSSDTVSIPVRVHSGGTVTIHWGDDSNSTVSGNGAQPHTYQDSGRYQVAMTGDLSRIITSGSGSTPGQLLSIDQWGDGTWGSMKNAFKGATNMEYKATDTPDLSGVTDMDGMFRDTFFTGNLSGWDVSNVETMNGMFYDANRFDGSLSGWNVSAVTNMNGMFRGAYIFNQPLSSWDTSGVTDMRLMFHGAQSFNGNISSWDTSGVENMREMFRGAISFNGTISGWNVSGVTNMRDMFNGAGDFNQDISGWNVSRVTNMEDMFSTADSFQQNLGKWYVVLNSTETGGPGIVGGISAQNAFLNAHNSTYGIGTGPDSDHFEITGGNLLNLISVDSGQEAYSVNVTASGDDVFESGNNWRLLNVTVMGTANAAPTARAGADLVLAEGAVFALNGSATDPEGEDLTYLWSQDPEFPAVAFNDTSSPTATITLPQVTENAEITLTLTASDTSSASASDSLVLEIRETGTAFLTTWSVTGTGTTVSIPTRGSYGIVWGDGSAENVTGDGTQSHDYPAAGEYQVAMTGGLSRMDLSVPGATPGKLASIDQWGDIRWASMERAFRGASNMEYNAADSPDLSRVTDMRDMFYEASSFNGNLSGWNVSSVNRMDYMFYTASSFNGNLSSWDVSSVNRMDGMFSHASSFNGNLSGWNVSSVTRMDHMFSRATDFNGNISSWNASSVNRMDYMFSGASSFNGDLSGWNVSSVTDMTGTFSQASDFNQPLDDWNVSSVTRMDHMFNDAPFFNGNLPSWDVSSVNRMDNMFSGASDFNGNISSWNVSSVTRMDSMFSGASDFNGNISSWNVSSVTRMNGMFSGASSFNGNIPSWNVSSVISMSGMFNNASSFDQNLGKWYVVLNSTATDGPGIVGGISAQNAFLNAHNSTYGIGTGPDSDHFEITGGNLLNLTSVDPGQDAYTANVTASGDDVFESGNNWRLLEVTALSTNLAPTVRAGPDLVLAEGAEFALGGSATDPNGDDLTYSWSQDPESPAVAFSNASSPVATITLPQVLTDAEVTLTLTASDTSSASASDSLTLSIRETGSAFLTTWSVTGTGTTVSIPTEGSYGIVWGDGRADTVTGTGTQSHTYPAAGEYQVAMTGGLSRMDLSASGATPGKLASIDQWGGIGWTSMEGAFQEASSMEYGAADAPDLSGVTNMGHMFEAASSFNGNISGWDVSSVTDMNSMFIEAPSFNQSLNAWDVSSVTDMNSMFAEAHSFNGNISGWDVSSVTLMDGMFHNAPFNQSLNAWNVSSVTGMTFMFSGTTFNQNISAWDVSSATGMDGMFSGASSFNQPLNAWNVSSATGMGHMFSGASSFNGNVSSWNVSSVTGMDGMFEGASSFNGNISAWDVSRVTEMSSMFQGASSFDQNLGSWYVVPADTAYDASEGTLNVTTVSAQNAFLDGHEPEYGIGAGGNPTLFNMTGGALMFEAAPDAGQYSVNITASGDDVFGTGNHRVYNVTVTGAPIGVTDGTPPEILAARATARNAITVTFSEDVYADSTDGSGWSITGNDAGTLAVQSNTDPAGSSSTMNLTLSGNLPDTAPDLSLAYAAPATGGITDTANPANPLGNQTVEVADGIPPVVESARATSPTGITLTMSEIVNSSGTGPNGFAVSTTGTAVTVSSIGGSNSDTLVLTLSGSISDADTITVSYGTGDVRDLASNPLAGFSGRTVDTSTDITPPTFVSATYSTGNGVLTITFSEPIGGTANLSQLHVRESGQSSGGATLTGASQSVSGSTLTVTLTAAQQTTLAGLTAPELDIDAGAVSDANSNGIDASPDRAITVDDTTKPTFVSATYSTGSGSLVITFSEPIGGTANLSQLHVRESGQSSGGATLTGASQSVSGSTLTVALTAAQQTTLAGLATPQLDIDAGAVSDANDNGINASADRAITVDDTVPPTVQSARATAANTIVVTFSENVDAGAVNGAGWSLSGADAGNLTVTSNTDPGGSSDALTLTLSGSLQDTAPDLILTYAVPASGGITDTANPANPLGSQTVEVGDGIPPVVESARATSPTGITLEMSEDVTDDSAAPGDFTVTGVASSPTVQSVAASGGTVTLGLTAAMTNSDSPALAYAQSSGFILDASSNPLAGFSGRAVDTSTDITPPTVKSATLDSETGILVITFSETVDTSSVEPARLFINGSGWAGRVQLTGAVVTTASDSAAVSINLTGQQLGSVSEPAPSLSLDVGAGAVSDTAGNPIAESPGNLLTRGDRTGPAPTITTAATSPTNLDTIEFAVDFGEPIDAGTFGPEDILAQGGTASSPRSADGQDKNFTFTVGGIAEGRLTVGIPEGAVKDLAGNNSTESNPIVIDVDQTAPHIVAAYVIPPGAVSLTYSEAVGVGTLDGTGFALSGGGDVTANTDPGLGSGIITLTVTGAAAGNVTYDEGAGTVADRAGNGAKTDAVPLTDITNEAVIVPRDIPRYEAPPEVSTVGAPPSGLPPVIIAHGPLSLNFSQVLDSNGTANSARLSDSAVNLTATVGGVRITVSLPANTTATGDSSWDGLFGLPAPSGAAPPAPGQSTVHTKRVAFSVGADTALHVDRAVRILVPGEGGRNVFFSGPDGAPRAVPECAFGDSQEGADAGLTAGGDCHIDAGGDLAIWTRHLSHWGTYHAGPRVIEQEPETESEAPADDVTTAAGGSGSGSRGGGGGGSGGGGGGGGGAPAAIITDVRIYSVSWDCAAGSVAVTAGPDTDQLSVNIRTSSVGERPVVRAGGELPGTRSFTSAIAGADEFAVVEASLAYEGDQVITKIVNMGQCTGTAVFDRYEPPQTALRPEPEPRELCRDGRELALRDGNELLCLFPGTFEVLAERGWNLARP